MIFFFWNAVFNAVWNAGGSLLFRFGLGLGLDRVNGKGGGEFNTPSLAPRTLRVRVTTWNPLVPVKSGGFHAGAKPNKMSTPSFPFDRKIVNESANSKKRNIKKRPSKFVIRILLSFVRIAFVCTALLCYKNGWGGAVGKQAGGPLPRGFGKLRQTGLQGGGGATTQGAANNMG